MLDTGDFHRDNGIRLRGVFRHDGKNDFGGRFVRVGGENAEAGDIPVVGDGGADRVAVPHGSVECKAAGHVLNGGGIGIGPLQVNVVGARRNGDGRDSLARRNDNGLTVGKRDGHVALGGAVEADGDGHVADVVFRAAFAHGEADMELFRSLVGLACAAFFAVDELAVLPCHVEAAQAIEAAEQFHAGPLLIVRVVGRFRAGRRHEVGLTESGEEVPACDFPFSHFEDGHVLSRVGGIKIAQGDADTIFQREDQTVAGAGDLRFVSGEVENETGGASAVNGIGNFRQVQKNGIHTILLRGVFLKA